MIPPRRSDVRPGVVASGRLVYFDTYLSLGGGLTGIHYNFEHCIDPAEAQTASSNVTIPPVPAPTTVQYPTIAFGLGQRFFLTRKLSLKWDVRTHAIFYDLADGACDQSKAVSEDQTHFNITMQLGSSYFF